MQVPSRRRISISSSSIAAPAPSTAAAAHGGGVSSAAARHGRRRRLQLSFAVFAAAVVLLAASNLLLPRLRGRGGGAADEQLQQQQQQAPPPPPGVGPARGVFPRGCTWLEVAPAAAGDVNSSSSSSSVNSSSGRTMYQYLQPDGAWAVAQPAACRVSAAPPGLPPPGWSPHRGSLRTEVLPAGQYTTYRHLWYNGGRWYALVEGPGRALPAWKLSRNLEVGPLHVADANAWARSVAWRLVPGDTLLLDFIFFTHPTAIGHWWELLGPLASALAQPGAAGFARPPSAVVLLHLRRCHLMEWARAVLAVALGVGPGQPLPPVLMQHETDGVWEQLAMPLEGTSPDEWLVFERALVVKDVFTGGNRTFADAAGARAFRAAVYRQYGFPPPAPRRRPPRVITFFRKSSNRRVLNERQLLALLSRYGELRVAEFNATTPFVEQLAAMRDTGVLVSAHTSALANAMFLQPGSAVVELIQRHWTWNAIDQSFRLHTAQLGDVHHYAWRANRPNETVHMQARDAIRFANWSKAECLTEDCTEAATRVDIAVDLAALKALLDSRLPLVFRGARVADAALPWPEAL